MNVRELVKAMARGAATVAVVPTLCSFHVRALLIGKDRALEGSTQMLSLVPGLAGQYLRRAFLGRTLAYCDPTAAIEFGVLFSATGTRIDRHVYIGPRCHIGLAHLEADVLLGSAVHVPSGPETHGSADVSRPIREQPGRAVMVRIGTGSWVGNGAVVMADVGRHSVVGAGAVVTRPVPDYVIAGGVPARVLRPRSSGRDADASGTLTT